MGAVAVFCAFCMSLAFQMALLWVIANRRAPVGHWHFKLRRVACWVALRFGIASNVVGTFGVAVWHCGLALRLALRRISCWVALQWLRYFPAGKRGCEIQYAPDYFDFEHLRTQASKANRISNEPIYSVKPRLRRGLDTPT